MTRFACSTHRFGILRIAPPRWTLRVLLCGAISLGGLGRASFADDPPDAGETSFSLEEVRNYDSGGSVFSMSFTSDGHTLLIGGDMPQKNVKLWDLSTGQPVRTLDSIVGLVVACARSTASGDCRRRRGGKVVQP